MAALFAIIIVLILVIALVVYKSQKTQKTRKPSVGAGACTTDRQCPPGEICLLAKCVAPLQCRVSSDCKPGELCIAGKCISKKCTTSTDCAKGLICGPTGNCIKPPQCVSDKNCPQGLRCDKEGRCVRCLKNKDCPTRLCVDGGCVACSKTAKGKRACPSGEACITGKIPTCCKAPTGPIRSWFYPCTPFNCRMMGPVNPGDCNCKGAMWTYCVGGFCSCTPAQFLERCQSTADCGKEMACTSVSLGGKMKDTVCIYPGKNKCIYSYHDAPLVQTGQPAQIAQKMPNQCSKNRPYCAKGTCSVSSYGSRCSSKDKRTTQCTGADAPYCVGGYCTSLSGRWGEICAVNQDCGKGLTCVGGVCSPSP